MQMVHHLRVELIELTGEVPDLVVVAAVARYERRHNDDFARAGTLEIGHNSLEAVGRGTIAHEKTHSDRPANDAAATHGAGERVDARVPRRISAVRATINTPIEGSTVGASDCARTGAASMIESPAARASQLSVRMVRSTGDW